MEENRERITNINQVSQIFYINLEFRHDRNTHVLEQLHNIGIQNPTRFNAIKLPNGAVGCSMSHLRILEYARDNNISNIIIVEDDITFLNPSLFVNNLNEFLASNNTWDVVLLAGNNFKPYRPYNEFAVKVTKCQTTTGYLISSHYYDKLIDNIKTGLSRLIKEPTKHSFFAIDKHWFALQKKDEWYLITPLSVIQRPDYSNIEKKITDYQVPMLILNK
jgi:glycosyl transferase family 25